MKVFKNSIIKFGGPGSGPRPSGESSKDDSPKSVGGVREKGYTIKEIQDRYDDEDSEGDEFISSIQSHFSNRGFEGIDERDADGIKRMYNRLKSKNPNESTASIFDRIAHELDK